MTSNYTRIKRGFDILASGAGLLVLSPVLCVTGVIVRKKLGPPVIFRQTRPGLNGRPFTLYKFRSMLNVDTERGLITDAQRMTSFGRWIRSTSLDELPTLWNVLKGDMSIVGPRPLLMKYLPLYTPRQAKRNHVRPGITGLAQVSGRNALDWPERLELDVQYVENASLPLDLSIVIRTVGAVIKRQGISADGHVTMSEFGGNVD